MLRRFWVAARATGLRMVKVLTVMVMENLTATGTLMVWTGPKALDCCR